MIKGFKRRANRTIQIIRGRFRDEASSFDHKDYPDNTDSTDSLEKSWDGLHRLLAMANNNAPPMLSQISGAAFGLYRCIQQFESDRAQVLDDYLNLRKDLNDLCRKLSDHLAFSAFSPFTNHITNLAWGIHACTQPLLEQDQNNELSPRLLSQQERVRWMWYLRQVQVRLARFVLSESIDIWESSDQFITTATLCRLACYAAASYGSESMSRIGIASSTTDSCMLVVQQIQDWILHDKLRRVYLVTGAAGTGKTTITYSLGEWMHNSQLFAASCFYSRQLPVYGNMMTVVACISYQLARYSHPYRLALGRVLEAQRNIPDMTIAQMFNKLLFLPLSKSVRTLPAESVIVVDGLDECEHGHQTEQMIDMLLLLVQQLPVRLFVTSRSDSQLQRRIKSRLDWSQLCELSLDKHEYTATQSDLKTCLTSSKGQTNLLEADIDALTKQSYGSFIYAAVTVSYVGRDGTSAAERLRRVLSLPNLVTGTNISGQLNELYKLILMECSNEENSIGAGEVSINTTLHTLACVLEPLGLPVLARMLETSSETLRTTLLYLMPVLHYTPDEAFVAISKPAVEFLSDQVASGRFYYDDAQYHVRLALWCFNEMKKVNRPFNICNLESSYLKDQDVPDLDQRMNQVIQPELLYACRRWIQHLCAATINKNLIDNLYEFLCTRLLMWIEAMNLMQRLWDAIKLFQDLRRWAVYIEVPQLRLLINDALRFICDFASSSACQSTPHLYLSALALWPLDRPVSEHYAIMYSALPSAATPTKGKGKRSIYDEPDVDNISTRITQAHTGRQLLKGYAGMVASVAYLPNGIHVASGSFDNAIRIWDASTCQQVGQSLAGHTGTVLSVVYSPNSVHIASGSEDYTIRIWDTFTGQQVKQPLTGHTHAIRSVVYSPDGTYIASGSLDNTIRIWDTYTGQEVRQPLTGHTHAVRSVDYSRSGRYIVSGSFDNTIRIWDVHNGQQVGQSLEGHTSPINSVAYSPDGFYIVSGSLDSTIRIWDARTGQQVRHLTGHTHAVRSVAYSPDGAYIVSGSLDNTVRIWDTKSGQQLGQPFTVHKREVSSVAYSPDGTHIISGSHDKTVCIWSIQDFTNQLLIIQDNGLTKTHIVEQDGWILDMDQNHVMCISPFVRHQLITNSAWDEAFRLDLRGVKLGEG